MHSDTEVLATVLSHLILFLHEDYYLHLGPGQSNSLIIQGDQFTHILEISQQLMMLFTKQNHSLNPILTRPAE